VVTELGSKEQEEIRAGAGRDKSRSSRQEQEEIRAGAAGRSRKR
jgi:hypothetical protein